MDIEALIRQMTLEEKASLCSGEDAWHTKAVERLGIPAIRMSDGPHGLRIQEENTENLFLPASKSTCFPTGSALASSFDVELLKEVGQHLGREARAIGIHTVLGPAVNMKRSPLCGRNFEYYSEDPVVAGELGGAYVQGVQSEGVGTSVKHFAANNQEWRRMSISSEVSDQALHEIYLKAFETIVKKARPWTVMCSYNRVNGTYACENKMLQRDTLRNRWGYDGVVMTDWGAMNDRIRSLEVGLDLEMPSSKGARDKQIVQAVREGRLNESVLDETVRRMLTWAQKAMEGAALPKAETDQESEHAFARKAAGECAVLLKNEEHILPLRPGMKLAVIGEYAFAPRYQGGGSSNINSWQVDNTLDRMRMDAEIQYVKGFAADGSGMEEGGLEAAVEKAKSCDAAVIFAGLPDLYESESYDRKSLDLPPEQNEIIAAVAAAQPRTIVVLHNGSPVSMPWIHQVAGVLEMYLAGDGAGAACADILFGRVNPSGKLAETFPLRIEDTPCYLDYPGDEETVHYRENVYIGYRWYLSRKMSVLFPFGFGLSYTSFVLSHLQISRRAAGPDDTVEVSVRIKNTGSVAGKEVVQLYVAPPEKAAFRRPVRELKAFRKVSLQPGEEKEISFELDRRAFAYFNERIQDWYAEPGDYQILVGTSCEDLPLSGTVEIQSPQLPFQYHDATVCADIWRRFGQREDFEHLISQSDFAQVLREAKDNPIAREMLSAMPLHSIISFGGDNGEMNAVIEALKRDSDLKK